MTEDVDQVVDATPQGKLGEVFKAKRSALSYSLAYVASQTLLSEEVVKALEEEEFQSLPSPVFVRGYIRTYAKVLEIDPEPLINLYGQQSGAQDAPLVSVRKTNASLARVSNNQVPVWSTLGVFVIVIGLAISWWLHQEVEQPTELVATLGEQNENELDLPLLEDNYSVGLGGVSEVNESSLSSSNADIAELEEQENLDALLIESDLEQVEDVSVDEELVEQTPIISGNLQDPVKITVTFKEESWTEIFDVRKRRLLHGLIKPGAVRVIYGEAPFNVFFGNAPGVELKINDQPFDHIRYARGNNTARFQIEDTNT